MKAMLDPSTVAARIQGSAFRAHGREALFDLMTPSSQGWIRLVMLVMHYVGDSELSTLSFANEGSVSKIRECLFDLLFRVHHERAVARDGLAKRLS
jgi:hypothetical protein